MSDLRVEALARGCAAAPGDFELRGRYCQELIRAGDLRRALDEALTAYRAVPYAAIGAMIEWLDAELEPHEGPQARTKYEFQPLWLGEAARPQDARRTGWLAKTLATLVPARWENTHGLLARLAALEPLGPDPRIARALITILQDTPLRDTTYSASGLYASVCDALVLQGSVSVLDELRELLAVPRARTHALRLRIAAGVSAAIAGLEAAGRGAFVEAGAWSVSTDDALVGRLDALLGEVYASPEDDALRRALAAALPPDDPRAQLIELQLRPPRGEHETQARALTHGRRELWLGPDLARVLVNVRFERGFPVAGSLAQGAVATEAGWERAARAPALATLRRLEKGRANAERYFAFLNSPVVRSLTEVEIPTWKFLSRLADTSLADRLRCLTLVRAPTSKALLTIADAFPQVVELRVRQPLPGPLEELGWPPRLRRLVLRERTYERRAGRWERADR